jgi:hypothetical protein
MVLHFSVSIKAIIVPNQINIFQKLIIVEKQPFIYIAAK